MTHAGDTTPIQSSSGRGLERLLLLLAKRDVTAFSTGGESVVLLNTPAYARHILATNRENYTKETPPNRFFKDHIADGILTADGPRWASQRALFNASFRDLPRLISCTRKCLDVTVEALRVAAASNTTVNLTKLMTDLTLAITTRTLFGLPHEPFVELCSRLGAHLDEADSLLPDRNADRDALRALTLRALEEAVLSSEADFGPALTSMLDDDSHRGSALYQQMLTLMLAGFETTANSLTWAWVLLFQHRDIYRQLMGHARLESEEAQRYVRAVVDESLRLYPSAWIIGRHAVSADKVGDVDIPAGASVAISPYLLHRKPMLWHNPNEYDPSRFLGGGHRPVDRYAYIPFGAGPRFCIGSSFATEESTMILTRLCREFEFEVVEPLTGIAPDYKFVLRAPNPLFVTVA